MFHQQNRLKFLGKIEGLHFEESRLEPDQVEIVEDQIKKNKDHVDEYVSLIDRLVNIEHFPSNHEKVHHLRERMTLLMEENNTFRRVLWNHWLLSEAPNLAY